MSRQFPGGAEENDRKERPNSNAQNSSGYRRQDQKFPAHCVTGKSSSNYQRV